MKKLCSLALLCALLGALCLSALADGTWICPNCLRENDSNFCPACGTKRPEEKIICPSCGKEYEPSLDYAFCPDCGTSLKGDADEPDSAPAEESAASALPEATEHEPVTLTTEECQGVYREAVIGTAQLLARAITYCDGQSLGTSGDAKSFASMAQRFAGTDFGKPQKATILEIPQEQFRALCDALNCDGTRLASALNEKINSQFNKRYTEAAGQAVYSRDVSRKLKLETEDCVAALLVYENDIAFVVINGNNEQGVLFVSDGSVLKGFGNAYLQELFSSLDLTNVRYTLYESPEAIQPLLTEVSFQNPGYDFPGVLTDLVASEKSLLALVPRLYSCGLFKPDQITYHCAASYLSQHDKEPEDGLRAARFVSEKLDEAVKWLEPEGRKWHEKWLVSRSVGWPGAPQLSLPEDSSSLTENPLQAGDRILTLYRNERDDMTKFYLRLDIESALPAERIPETFAEANYILLVSTHWQENRVVNGITVHNAFSEILLYDAKTLTPVYRIGSQEDGLEGFGNVATSKNFYQSPRFQRIIAKINDKLLR